MSIDADTLDRVVQFHGHMCPGLAMGIRASEVALDQIGPHSQDEEVVAIVETDMCAVDAVQVLTGCTFGKGNLVHRDHCKNAYTFARRSDGTAVRISSRPEGFPGRTPEWLSLFARVRSGLASPEERKQFWDLLRDGSRVILDAPLDQLYNVQRVEITVPPAARVMTSLPCSACGEPVMETRVRRLEGRDLCLPCFEAELNGVAAVAPPGRRPSAAG